MRIMNRIANAARSLRSDRRGNVAIYWTVAAVPVILAVGVAIDVSRAYFVRERLYFALDAAGLAVGSSEGTQAEMRSEEHTSELQSLMRNSYAVFCLKKKNT